MSDLLILGGGVIGLSIAYELAGSGMRVRVLERGQPGRETSWAAAGILPPCNLRMRAPPDQWLSGFSNQLHAEWANRLREETGIDNGYHRCAGVYLAQNDAEMAELVQTCERWRREGLTVKWLHSADLDHVEPSLRGAYERFPLAGAALVAEEAQIRSPRHLQALIAACRKRGVQISPGVEVHDFDVHEGRVTGVRTSMGTIRADKVCLACGAWSGPLADRLGFKLKIEPVRGQMVLLRGEQPIFQRIINHGNPVPSGSTSTKFLEGRRYVVPRDDGRMLVGSTLEEAGFDRRNTAAAVAELVEFAMRLAPALRNAEIERCWTGFRPRGKDDMPYLGPAPGLANVFVAAGHFRHGVWLSTGTAVVMGRLIRGESAGVDLTALRVDR